MDKKNAVAVRIFGSEYTLVGTESEDYIKKVCDTVNEKMYAVSKVASLNPVRTAVLCAVNICDEKLKCEEKLDALKADNDKLSKQIDDLKTSSRVLKEENDYLKDEIRSLKISGKGK